MIEIVGTHWFPLFINRNTGVYFDYFGTEYIAQEEVKEIRDKLITNDLFRT